MKRQLLFVSLIALSSVYAQERNVGINTTSPGSTLTVNGSFAATYKQVTALNYTMSDTDYYLAWNGTSDGVITLPSVASATPGIQGRQYHIKNTGTPSMRIVPSGGELLDIQTGAGVNEITLQNGEYAMLIVKDATSGTTWEVVIVGKAVYQEPWRVQGTNLPATINTQNIYQMGNVGVGTNAPKTELEVNGILSVTAPGSFPNASNMTAIGWNSIEPGIGFTEFVNYRGTGNGGFKFYTLASGTPATSHLVSSLNINGEWRAASFVNTSDVRLKRNIVPLNNSLSIISQLKPVSYEKRANMSASAYNIKEIGFIAQEVKEILPGIVKEGEDKDQILSVNYIEIIPLLTKAVQELSKKVEDLEKANQLLNAKISTNK